MKTLFCLWRQKKCELRILISINTNKENEKMPALMNMHGATRETIYELRHNQTVF